MSDKRTVTTDALETLGTIITDQEKRDAIHLAVEPIVAVEKLYPGQDVGLKDGGAGVTDNPVGIVDPFLKTPVLAGERFWLVVYPRQIQSLRHVWSHPDFAEEQIDNSLRSESEKWLRELADSVGLSYSRLLDGGKAWVESKKIGDWGDYIVGGAEMEGEHVPDEFWEHYEAVTGERVSEEHRGSLFSCSC